MQRSVGATAGHAYFLFPDSFHRGKWNGISHRFHLFLPLPPPDIVQNSPTTRTVCRCSFERGASPRRFYRKSISGYAWNARFKGMIDGVLGTRGQADEKQRGRQQTTTTKNKPPSLPTAKREKAKTQERRKRRAREKERERNEEMGKNGKINCHKVVWSITRPAPDRA